MIKKMKVWWKKCGEPGQVAEIDGSLASMQALVGGYIEPYRSIRLGPRLLIMCNEEGFIKHLPANGWGIRGDWFVCAQEGEELVGLNEAEINFCRRCM